MMVINNVLALPRGKSGDDTADWTKARRPMPHDERMLPRLGSGEPIPVRVRHSSDEKIIH